MATIPNRKFTAEVGPGSTITIRLDKDEVETKPYGPEELALSMEGIIDGDAVILTFKRRSKDKKS